MFFPTDFSPLWGSGGNFLVENSCSGERRVFICCLKRMNYDENFFVILRKISTFAAPQNMWGVVTS